MLIKSIIVEGFKSFKRRQKFEFNTNGLFLVSGENLIEPKLGANGAGKSSLFDALTWILFGKTANNLKASSVGNWDGVNCKVELNFDNHVLRRTWNPNSLILDGIVITQEQLEKVINLNFQSFIYSILIPQFGVKFIDLSPTEKMEIFSSIMDEILIKWDGFSEKTKKLKDDVEKKITFFENKSSNIEGQLKSLQPVINNFNEWEEKRREKVKIIKEKIKNINDVDDIKNFIERLNADISIMLKDLNSFIEQRTRFREAQIHFTEKLEEENNRLVEMITQDKITQETIINLSSLKDGSKCPLCTNIINRKHIDEEIKRLSFKLQTEDIVNKEEMVFTLRKAIKNSLEGIKGCDNSITQTEKEINEKKLLISRKDNEILFIKKSKTDLEEELNKIKTEENPFKKLAKDSEKKKNILERILSCNFEQVEELREVYEIYKYWVKGFKEVKLMLTEEALVDLEMSINNNMQKLGLGDWFVKLSMDSETKSGSIKKGFSVLIKSPFNNGEMVPFDCWSGGEGQRIRIATTLGLSDFIKNRRGIECDLLILDEPTQFLSEDGINDLVHSLRDKVNNENIKLFLIDHRNLETLGVFTKVVNITKTEDGSIING